MYETITFLLALVLAVGTCVGVYKFGVWYGRKQNDKAIHEWAERFRKTGHL
jgi:hypothetical protein